jgi:hypothetical protein
MRKPVSDNSNAISLFPFIAVLLCTMGSLLVVLVATTRIARDRAKERAAARVAAATQEHPDDSKLRNRIDEAQAVLARIAEVRAQAEHEIQNQKLRLSHLEEQTRKLVNQVGDLKAAAAEMMTLDAEHFDDRRQAERELKRLQELVTDAANEVDAGKKEALGKKRSYAIMPYEGPNGTNRRPIYIECRRDAVIIQPEGIRLTEKDFMPPLDAGSPLAAALRAARDELVRTAPKDERGKPLEPYPLILVRPDGIEAYYAVRRAVAEWDSEFGYEFVDGDWQLSFQPPDPRLAMVESQAVEHARLRRQALALAAPRAYRSGGGGGYGFGRAEGEGEVASTNGEGDNYAEGSSGNTGSETGDVRPAGGSSPYDNLLIGDKNDGRFAAAGGDDLPRGASGTRGGGNQRTSGTQSNQTTAGSTQRGGAASAQNPSAAGGTHDVAATSSQPNAGSASEGSSSAASGNGVNGPSVAASSAGGSNASPSSGSATAATGGGSPVPSADGAAGANTTTANVDVSPQEVMRDLSESRGENWALEVKGAASVPVRRSIRVIVRNDRFAILPEGTTQPTEGGQAIALKETTSQHVDEIVTAVQQEVRGWGIAGRGLYWRPVLVMQVGPGGETRAVELTRLLRNSGIELRPNASIGQLEIQPQTKR